MTTTIELKQLKHGVRVESNGEWETVLPDKIVVEEGDEIMVDKIFIDSLGNVKNFITLEDDITLYLDYALYRQDYTPDNKTYALSPMSGTPPGFGSGRNCFYCNNYKVFSSPENYIATGIELSAADPMQLYGDFELVLTYKATEGDQITYMHYYIKESRDPTTICFFTCMCVLMALYSIYHCS